MKNYITITWHVDDVQSVRPDLTREQAMDVLQRVDRNYDACIGISWQVIQSTADYMYPQITERGSDNG